MIAAFWTTFVVIDAFDDKLAFTDQITGFHFAKGGIQTARIAIFAAFGTIADRITGLSGLEHAIAASRGTVFDLGVTNI